MGHLGGSGGLLWLSWKPSWAPWTSWRAPGRCEAAHGAFERGSDVRIRARVRGWVVTRLRNAARQHLAFYYASTCEAARCRIAVPCRFLEVFSETSGCLPSTLRLRQMGLVNTCLGSPGWSNVFSGPRGYLRRSSQDPGLSQIRFVFFSFSWHPGAVSGLWVA